MTSDNYHNPNRLIRLPEVEELTGLSRTSVYRKIKAGEFPKSIPLTSRAIGWKYGDVLNWIDNQSKEVA